MPYPYGMYNAPVVGNGLGGLPRRTTVVPASTTPTYPQITRPLGDWVQIGSQVAEYSFSGYAGVAGSNAFFKYNTAGGTSDYYIGGVSFTSSSVTALSSYYEGSSGDTTPLDGRGWAVGNDFYYVYGNVLYKLSNSGGSVSRTTIKSNLIPDTGTYTVTGTAYRVDTNGYGGVVTPQFGSGAKLPACFANDDGTASVFVQTAVSVGGNYNLGCFVIDTSGNIVRSFKSGDAYSSIPTTSNYMFINKGLGQVTAFTFYSQGDPRMYYWASNVDTTAGTYTSTVSGSSSTDTQNLSNQQSFYTSPTLFSYGAQGTSYYYTWNFDLSNYSVSSFINFAQVGSTSVSLPSRKMFPEYQDMVYTTTYAPGASYYGPLDIKLQSNPANSYTQLLNYDDTSSATITPVSSGGTPFKIVGYRAKALAPSETDISNQFGPQDNAEGPWFLARLSATTYLVRFTDYNSSASPSRRYYAQLYQTA